MKKQVVLLCVQKSILAPVESLASRLPADWGMQVATPYNDYEAMKKTRRLYVRLTEEEYGHIKRQSASFKTMSAFIDAAIKEFSNTSARQNLDTRKKLAELYGCFDEKLAHLGGNLNQAMRRINEASKIGAPYNVIFQQQFMPRVEECYALCIELRKELHAITNKYAKE